MNVIIIGLIILSWVIPFIGIFRNRGLDPKKWSSWLYGFFGFVGGSLIGLVLSDIKLGLSAGLLFATGIMFAGYSHYLNVQRFKDKD